MSPQQQEINRVVKAKVEIQSKEFELFNLVNSQMFKDALKDLEIEYRDRIFSPLWTLWTFISQVLSADHSCQSAITKLQSTRDQLGLESISMNTGGYCRARERLTEDLLFYLVLRSGHEVQSAQPEKWLWHQREVKLVDGTTVSMADTSENWDAYNSKKTETSNMRFPTARIVASFSLSTGAVLDFRVSPIVGQGAGEPSIFMEMWERFDAGDILVFDKNFASYHIMTSCLERKIDFVSRLKGNINLDLHDRKKIGKDEWLLTLHRTDPHNVKTKKDIYKELPEAIELRLIKVNYKCSGHRQKSLLLITSLLDTKAYPKEEIAALYGLRWDAELDLRSLKAVLKMDVLRAKTPKMVRKEIYAHILSYNLIRIVMAQAAAKAQTEPRHLSFKLALQIFESFRPFLSTMKDKLWAQGYMTMLTLIASQTLLHRPGRLEPRAVRRRPHEYGLLSIPRAEARKKFWKRGNEKDRRKAHSLSK